MFNQIQVPKYSRLVRKLLRIVEDNPMPQLQGELTPVIVVDQDQPSWNALLETRMISSGANRDALAGQYSHVMVYNPAGSGVIATIKKMRIRTTAACVVKMGWQPIQSTALWDPGIWTSLDSRVLKGPIRTFSRDNATIIPTAANRVSFDHVSTTASQYDISIVLAPNEQFVVVPDLNNTGIFASFDWEERWYAPDEHTTT